MTAIAMPPVAAPRGPRHHARSEDATLSAELDARVTEILARRPAVGLSVGLLRGGRSAFCSRGLADIHARTPVTSCVRVSAGAALNAARAVNHGTEPELRD